MTSAADQVAMLLLEDHVAGCLTHAIASGEGEPYVDEVMAVVRRAPAAGPSAARRQLRGRAAGPRARRMGVPRGGTTTLPRKSIRPPSGRKATARAPAPIPRTSSAAGRRARSAGRGRASAPASRGSRPRAEERLEVLPLQEVPVLALDLGPQPGRALELESHRSARSAGMSRKRACCSDRDLAAAPQDRLPEHRRPFHLEQEGQLARARTSIASTAPSASDGARTMSGRYARRSSSASRSPSVRPANGRSCSRLLTQARRPSRWP